MTEFTQPTLWAIRDMAPGYPWLHLQVEGQRKRTMEVYNHAPTDDVLNIEIDHDADCGTIDIDLPKPAAVELARRILTYYGENL